MKKLITICILCIATQTIFCFTAKTKSVIHKQQQKELGMYTGKYQMLVKGHYAYIEITLKDNSLVLTALWDKRTSILKRLAGDRFIKADTNWPVEFKRDKNKQIIEVVVMGTDHWTKVR